MGKRFGRRALIPQLLDWRIGLERPSKCFVLASGFEAASSRPSAALFDGTDLRVVLSIRRERAAIDFDNVIQLAHLKAPNDGDLETMAVAASGCSERRRHKHYESARGSPPAARAAWFGALDSADSNSVFADRQPVSHLAIWGSPFLRSFFMFTNRRRRCQAKMSNIVAKGIS